MHPNPSFLRTAFLGAALALGIAAWTSPSRADAETPTARSAPPTATQDQPQQVIVHLKHGTDDLHAASMALGLATEMARRGAKVTLFLDLEAARLADSRQPNGLRWGGQGRTIGQLWDGFLAAGGDVLVCPHCAEAIGLEKNDLRKRAKLATFEQIADAMLAADKVLDY